MTPRKLSLVEKLSNSQALSISLGLAGLGLVGLILVVWRLPVDKHPFWYPLLSNLSGVVLTTGGLGALWDFVGRRNLIREVLHHVDLAEEIVEAGITRVAETVERAPWSDLISSSKDIKIHLAYGGSWFSNNSASLRKFAQNKRNRLEVFLPDPEDETIVASLAHRFHRDADVVRRRILDSAADVLGLSKTAKGTIKVCFRSGQPTHSFYQFDEKYVLVLYPHTGIRTTETPFLILEDGTFAKFVKADFASLASQSREIDANELARIEAAAVPPHPTVEEH